MPEKNPTPSPHLADPRDPDVLKIKEALRNNLVGVRVVANDVKHQTVTVTNLDISFGQMIALSFKAIPAIFLGGLFFGMALWLILGLLGISLGGLP